MQTQALAVLLFASLLLQAHAAPFRFEVEGKIRTASDSTGVMLGTTDGSSLVGKTAILQVQVDDSMAGDWIAFNLFVDGRAAILPRYDLGNTTANVNESGPTFDYSAQASQHDLFAYRYEENMGYVWGYEPGIGYWESATFQYYLAMGLMAWVEGDDPWFTHRGFDGLVDRDSPDLIVDAWIEFNAHGGLCDAWEAAHGCDMRPTERSSGSLTFRGQTARRGWSDMTATVGAGNLAPLLGLLLFGAASFRRVRK